MDRTEILARVRPSLPAVVIADRGADEILLSKDKTIAIIDGSGTLHDPLGLDRTELTRLAKERLMIVHFDVAKLSKDGYKVLCEDRDVTLPCTLRLPPHLLLHAQKIADGALKRARLSRTGPTSETALTSATRLISLYRAVADPSR